MITYILGALIALLALYLCSFIASDDAEGSYRESLPDKLSALVVIIWLCLGVWWLVLPIAFYYITRYAITGES